MIFRVLQDKIRECKYSKTDKVFCIGRNKTGTTSMAKLFESAGLDVAPQEDFEILIKDWNNKDFDKIIDAVKYKGIAFQDIPFSLPDTYKILDENFPSSKFILTVRDCSETWYSSLINFHSKMFGNGSVPSKEDLKNAEYIYRGWLWDVNRMVYNTPENDIYNKNILMNHYIEYNNSVIEYFKDKPNKLLVINLKNPNTLNQICEFLEIKKNLISIPWENKT